MYFILFPSVVTTIKQVASVPANQPQTTASSWLEAVRTQVDSLRFGQVQIVVHDARVVQIERIEKIRIDQGTTARW